MKISKEIVEEALRRLEESPMIFVLEKLEKMRSENPHLAEFLEAVFESWKEDPPPDLERQSAVLLTDLVVLADMFRRQEEVDKLEKQFG